MREAIQALPGYDFPSYFNPADYITNGRDAFAGAFQPRIGVYGLCGGLCGGARATCDYLKCGLGHFSNTGNMANRSDPVLNARRRRVFIKPRGRGIHGQVTVYV